MNDDTETPTKNTLFLAVTRPALWAGIPIEAAVLLLISSASVLSSAETSTEPLTMGAFYRHLTDGDARVFFKKELAKPGLNLSVGCRTALADFAGGSDNSFADIKKTITNVLGLWFNPLVDAATAASDFDLRQLRKASMSIYLSVSPDELDRIAPLYNLLFQQLIDLNVRDLPDESTPVPVLVILDEFARLGRASVIASAFSYVAGYGIRLLPVIQSRSQLRGVYGEHVADEIVANDLSERLGYVGQDSVTRSLTINGLLANRSKSISEQRRALLLLQELLRGGIPPIIGAKIAYFSNRFFKARSVPRYDRRRGRGEGIRNKAGRPTRSAWAGHG